MKKVIFLSLLLSFLGLQAVESQYFGLEQKAQTWLKDEKTQKYIKRNKEQILAILTQDNRGGIVIDGRPFAISIDDVEELQYVLFGMTGLIQENAAWFIAQSWNCQDEYSNVIKLEGEALDVAYQAMRKPVESSYATIEEFKEQHMQAEDAGVLEACDYLIKVINEA